MLPFIIVTNKEREVVPGAKKFLKTVQVSPDKLTVFSVGDFEAGILPAADCHSYTSGESALIMCGFIRHPDFVWDWEDTNTAFFDKLLTDLNKMDAAAIRASYTGNFTIFLF